MRSLHLFSILALAFTFTAQAENRGRCSYSKGPGFPVATCTVPNCLAGANCECPSGDCEPPSIQMSSSRFQFHEPLVSWSNKCKKDGRVRPCWMMGIPFTLEVGASDRSGVEAIGVEIASAVGFERTFRKIWVTTTARESHRVNGQVNFPGLPSEKMKLSVLHICARDRAGNERCAVPGK